MSDYVCKIEETVDRLVDQEIREFRFSQAKKKMSMIERACSGDVGAIKTLSYMQEAEKELGNYADRVTKELEEQMRTSGDCVKMCFLDLCSMREQYLSDGKDSQLRERLCDWEQFKALYNMGKFFGMKSWFGISTREEYLEWIEGERELDFQCV